MPRITNSATNSLLIARFLQSQKTLNDYQTQVSTGKLSQTYSGLATSSQRLVNIENTKSSLEQFVSNNNTANLRLNVQSTALDGVQNAITNFREYLLTFSSGDTKDPDRIDDLQQNAFRALKDIQTLLNTEADGRFVFGGGQVRTEPVTFGLSSLADFQATYDGTNVTVPTTSSAHLADFSFGKDNTTLNPAFLSFEQADGGTGKSRINSSVAQFQNVAAGTTITISGTVDGLNDGTYTVDSVDPNGLWIDVKTEQLTDETTPVDVTISYPDPNDPRTTQSKTAQVTFDRRTNTITSVTSGDLSDIPEGSVITIAGSASNDGTYTVDTNDDTNIVIKSKRLTDDGGTAATVHTADAVNTLTFSGGTGADGEDQIIAVTAGTYSSLQDGQKIVINNTNTENDGKTFTVKSVSADGTTITLDPDDSVETSTATVTTGTVSTSPALFSFNAASRNFYFDASVVGADDVTFTDNGANADTITLNGGRFMDAQGNLLAAGMRISVTGTASNNGTFTVASISSDGLTATLVPTDTLTNETNTAAALSGAGSMSFTHNASAADTVTLGGGFFRDSSGNNFPAGTIFTVAGTGTANDGSSFTIASVSSDGRTATLIPTNTVTTGSANIGTLSTANTIGTISASSYYNGDKISATQRVSQSSSFDFDLTAVDPAFEKAIRAMMLIMQGDTGSEGGLDQHNERIGQAMYLLDSSLNNTNTSPPPFGTEAKGSVEEASIKIGYHQVLINDINTINKNVIGFLDGSIADTENANDLDAITHLLDTQQALQASYQTFARVRQLSLTNYL